MPGARFAICRFIRPGLWKFLRQLTATPALLDLAIIAAREVPRIAPSAMQGRLILASALVRSGWLADARRVADEARVLNANLSLGRWAASQPYRDANVLADIVGDLGKLGIPQ